MESIYCNGEWLESADDFLWYAEKLDPSFRDALSRFFDELDVDISRISELEEELFHTQRKLEQIAEITADYQ